MTPCWVAEQSLVENMQKGMLVIFIPCFEFYTINFEQLWRKSMDFISRLTTNPFEVASSFYARWVIVILKSDVHFDFKNIFDACILPM